MDPKIRPFRDSDTPRLVSVLETVFAEYGMRFDPDGYDRDVRAIGERYAAPGGVFYTAEVDGRPLGFAGADVPQAGVAELHRLYLDPRARGLGLGSRLVGAVESWARERAAGTVELWSDVRFCHAHALYAKLGYGLFGQRQLEDPDRSVEFGFRRELDRAPAPVVHALNTAVALPLGTDAERLHRCSMIAAAILDSRALVRAGRVHRGGHERPSVSELFANAPRIEDVRALELPGEIVCGFELARTRERRAHPLFGAS
jgi:putative acetyltransferase